MDRDERDVAGRRAALERGHLTMSYILDALKKSEAERSRGAVPTLLIPAQTQFKSSLVLWIVLGALIVNACLFAAWIFWPASASTPAISTQVATPATKPAASAANNDTVSQSPPVREVRDQPNDRKPPAATGVEASSVAPTETRIGPPPRTAGEESAPTTFSFSTHVYASDPSMRAVTMNGRRFVEGDTIAPGVTIMEITESGVVLDINGQTTSMDVLQDWR